MARYLNNLENVLSELYCDNNQKYWFRFLSKVSPDEKECEQCEQKYKIIEKRINSSMNKALYDSVIWEFMSCKKIIDTLRLNGAHLSADKYVSLSAINNELMELSVEFSKNISADSCPEIELTSDEIDAVTELGIEVRDSKIELSPDTYYKIMENCTHRGFRKKCYVEKNNRPKKNKSILERAYKLRSEKAELLGFSDVVEMELTDAHLKTHGMYSQFVGGILPELIIASRSLAEKIASQQKISVNEFNDPCSTAFFINRYKQSLNNFDYSGKYFNLRKTLDYLSDFYADKLDIVIEIADENKWVKNILVMSVYDSHDKTLLGKINLDLHHRKNKHPHSTCWLISRASADVNSFTESCLTLSLQAGKAEEVMISHSNLVTMFHEIGHGIHEVINKTNTVNCGGIEMERDLVEVASMYFENYCWERELLSACSDLSADDIEKLIAGRNIDSGYFWLRQLVLSALDRELNTGLLSVDSFEYRYSELTGSNYFPGVNLALRWVHQFGYECKYYSYIYSACYAAQLWEDRKNPDHKSRLLHFLKYSSGETLENTFGKLDVKHFMKNIS